MAKAHTLPNNSGFANAGIGNTQIAVLILQTGKALVNIANSEPTSSPKATIAFITIKISIKASVQ
jgi:hypothetical protein